MKRRLVVLMAALMMMVTSAIAESASMDLLAQMDGQVFEFSSGVGAWSTELTVGENGTFTGSFHDSEMGETGENYPDGTLYGCSFHGQFSDPEPVDEHAWTVNLSVEQDEGQVPEAIEDGIRYVTAAPYGLEKAQAVTVFLPGTPVDRLPEGFMIWSHLQEIDPEAKSIPYYAIWNEAYFSLNENPKAVMIGFAFIGLLNLGFGIARMVEGTFLTDGKLTYTSMNFMMGIVFMIIFITLAAKQIANKREEE